MGNQLATAAPTTLSQATESVKTILAKPGNFARLTALCDGDQRLAQRVASGYLMLIEKNATVRQCTPASLINCLLEAASAGFELNTTQRHVAIVPFFSTNKETDQKEWQATLIPQYQGLRELIRRAPNVVHHGLACVHEGDHFEYMGSDQRPIHRENIDGDRISRPVLYAYVWAEFANGSTVCTAWSIDTIRAHRDRYSKSWTKAVKEGKAEDPSVFWSEKSRSFPTMCAKSVLRFAVGNGDIPINTNARRLLESDILDATAIEVRDEPEPTPALPTTVPPKLTVEPSATNETPQTETVEQTENDWKNTFLKALEAQTKPNDVREVYASIREIADKNPEDGCWAEDQYKRRLKELGTK